MKKILFVFILFATCFTNNLIGQETVKPSWDVKIERKLDCVDIEGIFYDNVIVKIKSISPDYLIYSDNRVKIKITKLNSEVLLKKTLKHSYVWIFSDGQIQIGQPHFCRIALSKYEGRNYGIVRLKEGIYEK